ncbi:hypothetical protein MANES_10G077702v8 [Manihot esculenta]|uniref:Uncharacterized protein n=1 Tax=Manihot esculenta TaxID=3983 RepID=A0ACB7H069_MANES|nr:hypothetical protein MANES_10G077702v8 [Manihot esculenta]
MATKNKSIGKAACMECTNLSKRNGGGWRDKRYTWLQNQLKFIGVELTKEHGGMKKIKLYEKYQVLFQGTMATKEFAYVPSFGVLNNTGFGYIVSFSQVARGSIGDCPNCSIEEVMKDVLSLPLTEGGSDIHFVWHTLTRPKVKKGDV